MSRQGQGSNPSGPIVRLERFLHGEERCPKQRMWTLIAPSEPTLFIQANGAREKRSRAQEQSLTAASRSQLFYFCSFLSLTPVLACTTGESLDISREGDRYYLECFGHRRVDVNQIYEVVGRRPKAHCHRRLMDDLACIHPKH